MRSESHERNDTKRASSAGFVHSRRAHTVGSLQLYALGLDSVKDISISWRLVGCGMSTKFPKHCLSQPAEISR